MPQAGRIEKDLHSAREKQEQDGREQALISLYQCLHSAGASYQKGEEEKLSEWQGNFCHPGGMMPLLLAGCLAGPFSSTADLGAGNGLQSLLLQAVHPHRRSFLVEISGRLVETGRLYQKALGLDADRICWMHQDIADADLKGVDLVYLYRPARPLGNGKKLYRKLAGKLSGSGRNVTIVSMADCLGSFLSCDFRLLYSNEFLSIFSRNPSCGFLYSQRPELRVSNF